MLGRLRTLLWIAVGIAAIGTIYLAMNPPSPTMEQGQDLPMQSLGGPFTLVEKPIAASADAGRRL